MNATNQAQVVMGTIVVAREDHHGVVHLVGICQTLPTSLEVLLSSPSGAISSSLS